MYKKVLYNSVSMLVIGVGIGLILRNWHRWTFDFEVSMFDLLALAVTIGVAWWVAEKLEKDSDKERCEKDILLEKLKVMDGTLDSLSDNIKGNRIVSLSKIVSMIGRIDAISERVINQIKTNYPSVIGKERKAPYSEELELLDELCSDDSDGGMASDVQNDETICMYSPDRASDIIDCISRFPDKMFDLEIALNKA